ncbi:MAG: SCO family protein [Opitutae bacterium]|nr:SCO family protein [Opitutae bacterium]
MMKFFVLTSLCFSIFSLNIAKGNSITALVESSSKEHSVYHVKVINSENEAFESEARHDFQVGLGDQSDHYIGRQIKANAVYYANQWHLESIFPKDGVGSKAYYDLNDKFHRMVKPISRRNFVQEDDYIIAFSGINQKGDFFQFKDFLGKAVVVNFIFTRCQAAKMCPASTYRMSLLQEKAKDIGLDDLHLLSITFDPEYDSPGILKQYGESYDIEFDTFTFMTAKPQWIEDLMRYFGIVTIDQDGTINHTMATLLIDQKGRVHYRKEGSVWKVDDFLTRAQKLLKE